MKIELLLTIERNENFCEIEENLISYLEEINLN